MALPATALPRASAQVERSVLIIGPTGVGKSTLLNMLFHDSYMETSGPAMTAASAASCTKNHQMFYSIPRQWVLIDTIGLGDPDLTAPQIVGRLRTMLDDALRGINCVVMVAKLGRLSAADRINFELLRDLFADEDLKRQGVLVLTHYEGEMGQEAAELEAWRGADPFVAEVLGLFGKVVVTNNATRGRAAYPEIRQRCVEHVGEFVHGARDRIRPKAINFGELLKRIFERFLLLFRKTKQSIGDVMSNLTPGVFTSCGECGICLENMAVKETCFLDCNHAFHGACIEHLPTRACPVCRRPFANVLALHNA